MSNIISAIKIFLLFHVTISQILDKPYLDNVIRLEHDTHNSLNQEALRELNHIKKKPTYLLLAPKIIQPDKPYHISVNLLDLDKSDFYSSYFTESSTTVRASLQRDGDEIGSASKTFQRGIPGTLTIPVPSNIRGAGVYRLKVSGDSTRNSQKLGTLFNHVETLTYDPRIMAVMIQLDRPLYKQGQKVRFRVILVKTDFTPFLETVNVYMLDPKGNILKRWLNRQSNLGSLSLEYQLGRRPEFGDWTINVTALGQSEFTRFKVEEYFESNFEVNLTMPHFFMDNVKHIDVRVEANYTYYVGVYGKAVIEAYLVKKDLKNPDLVTFKSPAHVINVAGFNGRHDFPIYLEDLSKLLFSNSRSTYSGSSSEIAHALAGHELIVNASVNDPRLNKTFSGFGRAKIHGSHPKLFRIALSERDGSPIRKRTSVQLGVETFGGSRPFTDRITHVIKGYQDLQPIHTHSMDDFATATADYNNNASPVDDDLKTMPDLADHVIVINIPTRAADANHPISVSVRLRLAAQNEIGKGKEEILNIKALPFSSRDILSSSGQLNAGQLKQDDSSSQELPVLRLNIESADSVVTVGGYAIFGVSANFRMDDCEIYYHIISKGAIVFSNKLTGTTGHKVTFSVALEPEMAPSSKLLVYAISAKSGRISADAVNFYVDATSRNNFTLILNTKKDLNGYTVEVVCQGQPGSFIGLSAIDNTLYDLRLGNDITWNSVRDQLTRLDTQLPTSNNPNNVRAISSPSNSYLSQDWTSPRSAMPITRYFPWRSAGFDSGSLLDSAGLIAITDIEGIFDGCLKSLNQVPCFKDNSWQCVTGTDSNFLVSQCSNFQNFEHDSWNDFNRLDRYDEALSPKNFHRFNEIYDSSWLWRDFNIGTDGYYIFTAKVKKRPALWAVNAFSLSKMTGLGLLPNVKLYDSTLPFYFVVDVPDRIKQGEQLGIRVALFNYFDKEIEVLVSLEMSPCHESIIITDLEEGIVHSYSPETQKGERQVLSWVEPGQTQLVYIPIVFTHTSEACGKINAKSTSISLTALTQIAEDKFEKFIFVEIGGVKQVYHTPYLIDLTNKALQTFNLYINVTETPVIPLRRQRNYIFGSPRAEIGLVGDVTGPVFYKMPFNALNMLDMPYWCGEQVLFNFAANFYTLRYLQKTNQLNKVVLSQGAKYMNIYYQRLMSHMKNDGGLCLFQGNDCETDLLLTAQTLRVLHEASRLTEWDETLLYIPKQLLELPLQRIVTTFSDFLEFKNSESRHLGSLSMLDRSHVLLALLECDDTTGHVGARSAELKMRLLEALAIAILGKRADANTRSSEGEIFGGFGYDAYQNDTYTLAIVTYALSLGDHVRKGEALKHLIARHRERDDGLKYWCPYESPHLPHRLQNNQPHYGPREYTRDEAICVETTSYALLAILLNRSPLLDTYILPIIKWLNQQRNHMAGFDSTRDTIVAMQALTKYSESELTRPATDIRIEVQATSDTNFNLTLAVGSFNLATFQRVAIPNVWGSLKVTATGRGLALFQLRVSKNIDWREYQRTPPVDSFQLTHLMTSRGFNSSILDYHICSRWTLLSERPKSGMSVIEIDIPSGYIVHQTDLDNYVNSARAGNFRMTSFNLDKQLEKAEFLPDIERAVFYFNHLDSSFTCFNLSAERWYPIANMSEWHTIKVFEYYNPTHFNTTMYEAYNLKVLDICHVCGSFQCPYCPNFNSAPNNLPGMTNIFLLLCTMFVFIVHV
ncbi:unnamed protein product [Gordionus sp. m RMFG-2023]